VQDAEWIADLLQHGLLTASFVPSQEQQDVRDLTRLRVNLVHKVLVRSWDQTVHGPGVM
jgi:transposase